MRTAPAWQHGSRTDVCVRRVGVSIGVGVGVGGCVLSSPGLCTGGGSGMWSRQDEATTWYGMSGAIPAPSHQASPALRGFPQGCWEQQTEQTKVYRMLNHSKRPPPDQGLGRSVGHLLGPWAPVAGRLKGKGSSGLPPTLLTRGSTVFHRPGQSEAGRGHDKPVPAAVGIYSGHPGMGPGMVLDPWAARPRDNQGPLLLSIASDNDQRRPTLKGNSNGTGTGTGSIPLIPPSVLSWSVLFCCVLFSVGADILSRHIKQ